MKKQFAIKAIQTSKNVILSAAKNESATILKLVAADGCCPTVVWMRALAPQTSFSL